MQPLQIAIDGPVAAGKGDIAARLAGRLGLLYVYTGAMYRALALACIRKKVSFRDAPNVLRVLKESDIDLAHPEKDSGRTFRVLLDGEDVTDRIFEQDVAQGSSDVSTIPEVRVFLVEKQKELAKDRSVVMEGRDIGLRVLPNAQLKIYLTASVEERARRRYKQWKDKGLDKTYAETLTDTIERDKQDMNRAADPLVKLPDAWELDTTTLNQEQTIAKIIAELKKRKLV